MSNRIAFMTANFVARETGWAMHGWGHGDRETQEAFRPLETYAERLDAVFRDVRALGFDTVDLWGAHLSPDWATDDHVEAARSALRRHGLQVATYATWVGPPTIERACELALALDTNLIGAGFSGDPEPVATVLHQYGVTLAIENHSEKTPAELVAKIERGEGAFAATVDTGWWGTQGYDAALAIEELVDHVAHVHLKDVEAVGEPHETCRWGEGIVDVAGCVEALVRNAYSGTLTIEHEPEHHDPSEDVRAMRAQLEEWLR